MPSKEQTHSSDKESAKRRPQPALGIDQLPQPQLQPATLQQAQLDPGSLAPRDVSRLQRMVGNQAVVQLLARSSGQPRPAIQPKLTVGAAGDAYEQEADRTAEQVMSMPTPAGEQHSAVQRQGEDEVQAKTDPMGSFEAGSAIEGRLAARQGGGSPLPSETRAFMEPRFGADLGGVRVHTDGEAAQLNRELSAQAFTHGQDIYMSEGRYNPGTDDGKRLLAHELTHVVQQTGGAPSHVQRFNIGSAISGPGHEILTEEMYDRFSAHPPVGAENLVGNSPQEKEDFKKELITGSTWNDMPGGQAAVGATYVLPGVGGTISGRSHHGDLLCLHAMAQAEETARRTQDRILKWVEFCYKIAVGEIRGDAILFDVCPTFFDAGYSKWTVEYLFGVGEQMLVTDTEEKMVKTGNVKARALGSLMHTLEDSFCASHAEREIIKQAGQDFRRIKSFRNYEQQNSKRHAKADIVEATGTTAERVRKTEGGDEIASIGQVILTKAGEGKRWAEVVAYFNQVFGLAPDAAEHGPTTGRQFRAVLWPQYGENLESQANLVESRSVNVDGFKPLALRFSMALKEYDDLLEYKYQSTDSRDKIGSLERQKSKNQELTELVPLLRLLGPQFQTLAQQPLQSTWAHPTHWWSGGQATCVQAIITCIAKLAELPAKLAQDKTDIEKEWDELAFERRMEEDASKHRMMNLWG